MSIFFEIPGLNIYLQLFFTILSFSIYLLLANRHHKQQALMITATASVKFQETPLEAFLLFTIGLSGWFSIINGLMGHIVYADQVASSIGWPLHSGFQMELAFASIGIGIIGCLGFWKRAFWLPFIIAKSSLMIGAGITHLIHLYEFQNVEPGNAGVVLYWDFAFPILIIVAYAKLMASKKV